MNLEHKIKPRDAKNNPLTAIAVAVFAMFIVSGLLLLLLALLLYKMEPGESVIKIGIVVIYVIAGFLGGLLMGKIMRERKFLWGLAAGVPDCGRYDKLKKYFPYKIRCGILYGLIEFYRADISYIRRAELS